MIPWNPREPSIMHFLRSGSVPWHTKMLPGGHATGNTKRLLNWLPQNLPVFVVPGRNAVRLWRKWAFAMSDFPHRPGASKKQN
jgi:hypothetical protein